MSNVNSGGEIRYRTYKSITDQFEGVSLNATPSSFQNVRNHEQFYDWFEHVALKAMYADDWYNGDRVKWKSQRFLSDRSNFIVGVPYLKQMRVRNESLLWHEDDEEMGTFGEKWSNFSESVSENMVFSRKDRYKQKLWNYTVPKTSINFPAWYNTYSEGGFGTELGNNKNKTVNIFNYIKDNSWITNKTRAVLLEFTTFNPSRKMFASVTI